MIASGEKKQACKTTVYNTRGPGGQLNPTSQQYGQNRDSRDRQRKTTSGNLVLFDRKQNKPINTNVRVNVGSRSRSGSTASRTRSGRRRSQIGRPRSGGRVQSTSPSGRRYSARR